MKYVKANLVDLEQIINMKNDVKKRIENEYLPIWLNGYPMDESIIQDINLNQGRVVKIDDEVVAYAVFHWTSEEEDYPDGTFSVEPLLSFGRVMVKNGYTGKHIGDYLIRSLIEEAKTMNALGMGILADACNIKAVNLYKKYGFKYEKTNDFGFAVLDVYTLIF